MVLVNFSFADSPTAFSIALYTGCTKIANIALNIGVQHIITGSRCSTLLRLLPGCLCANGYNKYDIRVRINNSTSTVQLKVLRFLSKAKTLRFIYLPETMLLELSHLRFFLTSFNLVLILGFQTVVFWRFVAGLEMHASSNFFHVFFVPIHGNLLMKRRKYHLWMKCQRNVLNWLCYLNKFLMNFAMIKKICPSKN